MKASVFYRIAAVLALLFALGHTVGFLQVDPQWKADALIASMRSIHFEVQGFSRTYWDFYVGFGLFVTVFLLFAAAVAWQMGGLPAESLAQMRGIGWTLALCFAAVTVLSASYFFSVPLVLSILITLCLTAGAWLSALQGQRRGV